MGFFKSTEIPLKVNKFYPAQIYSQGEIDVVKTSVLFAVLPEFVWTKSERNVGPLLTKLS